MSTATPTSPENKGTSRLSSGFLSSGFPSLAFLLGCHAPKAAGERLPELKTQARHPTLGGL